MFYLILLMGLVILLLLITIFTKKENPSLLKELEKKQKEIDFLQQEKQKLQDTNTFLREEKAKLETTVLHLESTLPEMERRLNATFQNTSNKVLEAQSAKFKESSQEALSHIMNPVKNTISEYQKTVYSISEEQKRDRIALNTHIKEIYETNKSLSKALQSDNKQQGNWGEMQLERLLELSGLQEGVDYSLQSNLSSEDGAKRLQPDVIIHLPDNKKIIIDSKVSLVSYSNYANSEDEKEKEFHLKNFCKSIKSHIDNLSSKEYDQAVGVNAANFTVLFIAIEPSYILALREDPLLLEYAYKKNIVLSTSSTLLANLKSIAAIRMQEKQLLNTEKAINLITTLIDKFNTLYSSLKRSSDSLSKAQNDINASISYVEGGRGNILGKLNQIEELGFKGKKNLPKSVEDEDKIEEIEAIEHKQ